MHYVKSRKHANPNVRATQTAGALPLAAALAATLSLPLAAQAQSAPAAAAGQATAAASAGIESAQSVTVEGRRDELPTFKADVSASPKLTQPLLDTPKTVQVLTRQLMEQQGATTMIEALRNTPGITLQLGENGNTSAGDTFQLRGFATQSSTLLDGLRDIGAVSRDVFNIEQIEVVKGPAGADIGRGAAGGYINLISKQPGLTSASEVTLNAGTGDRKRLTADINHVFSASTAARLNVMTQNSGVDGRDVVKDKGTAIAPAIAFGLGTPTRVYLYSQHTRHDNVPDGGISTIGMQGFFNANPAIAAGAKVDRENFYGSRNDFERVDADMGTARLELELGRDTTLRSSLRYGKSRMDRVITGVNTIAAPSADPATWTLSRSRQRVDQENDILVNQTQLNTSFGSGGLNGIKHDLAAGIELIRESQQTLGTGTAAQTINGLSHAAIAQPVANLYRPNADDALGTPYLTGADVDGRTTTAALYAFDTLSIGTAWKINGGLRAERYKTKTRSGALANGAVVTTELEDRDTLVSWNFGAVYKPSENGSIYAAVANARNPPGGANFVLSAAAGNQANAALDPQETKTVEVGTKWDLLNKRLNLALAVYRAENEGQTTTDPVTGLVTQEGKTRVEGVELSAVGQITTAWQVTAGIASMKTRQLNQRSVSNGVTTVTDSVRWSPDLTASLWTSYSLNGLMVGGGVRHVSEQKRVIAVNAPVSNMPVIPAHTVADLVAAYRVNKNLELQFNVYNVFDKEYISTLNNGGSRVKLGAPRSMALTASLKF
jgi:catecholate siderophore receptor